MKRIFILLVLTLVLCYSFSASASAVTATTNTDLNGQLQAAVSYEDQLYAVLDYMAATTEDFDYTGVITLLQEEIARLKNIATTTDLENKSILEIYNEVAVMYLYIDYDFNELKKEGFSNSEETVINLLADQASKREQAAVKAVKKDRQKLLAVCEEWQSLLQARFFVQAGFSPDVSLPDNVDYPLPTWEWQ